MNDANKVRKFFPEMVVLKDPARSHSFSALSIPSYMRDWIIMRYADTDGYADMKKIMDFLDERLPKREEWNRIEHKLVHGHEEVTLLAKIRTTVDITTQETYFSLPDYDFPKRKKEAIVSPYVVRNFGAEALSKATDTWGVITLNCELDDKGDNHVYLADYTEFCPYDVELSFFREARKMFSIDEWLDILLGAIDLNPAGYITIKQKVTALSRLLPFVEKRLNLIELAPKGTGKSYVFSRISKYGWLASGSLTRAKLFYDIQAKQPGLLARCDYVALDEISSFHFYDETEMAASLKTYLESGEYKFGNTSGNADSGMILLGNISQELMDEESDMFGSLPGLFHSDSALLDRFHGFIKGWDIPRMRNDMIACDWALNVEYYSEMMHSLRSELVYRTVVDELIVVPAGSDVRDTESVKRLATGFLKLFFPHVTSSAMIDREEFNRFCFSPAFDMRSVIKKQMAIIDIEFRNKRMPRLEVSTYGTKGDNL